MNRKQVLRLLIVAVLLGGGLLFPMMSRAQEGSFHETFDAPALPNWEHSPEVSVQDGALRVPPESFAAYWQPWGALSLSVRLRCEGEGLGVVSYHLSDEGAYHVALGREATALIRDQNGEGQNLAEGAGVPLDDWVTLEVSVAEGAHTVKLNGQELFHVTDPHPIGAGAVGLSAWGEVTCAFDDLTISGESVEPPMPPELEAMFPAPTYADVVYTQGEGAPQALDIYLPQGGGPWPLVIYVHGGGWMTGDKSEGREVAAGLVPQGYAVVSIDYRLSPAHPFPAAIADTQCAVAWAKQHAAEYGWDAAHIGLMGASAGAHLVTLAGVVAAPSAPSHDWQPSCGDPNADFGVQAVVSFAGPMDMGLVAQTPLGQEAVEAFLGTACQASEPICAAASPLTYASADAPPILLVQGTEDDIVPPDNARQMYQALQAAGAQDAVLLMVEGAGHDVGLSLDQAQQIEDFLARHLQPAASSVAPATSATGVGQAAYMAESWVRLGGPPGGLGYDIRMRPDSPDVLFVTASPGGIFKSTDGGQWWQPVNQGIEPFPGAGAKVFTVSINPRNSDEVWVGTQFSGRLYRSTDGGQTWTRSDEGVRETSAENSIRGITFDPNVPNVLYMGMERGAEDVLRGPRGEIYKSSDGGAHWSLIWEGESLARYVWVDPRDSQRIYASTGFFDRAAHNADYENGECGGVGIVRSTDGGQTWEVLGQERGLGELFVPSLFMHPIDPDILIAAVIGPFTSPSGGDCAREGETGVYATYDGGDTWQRVLAVPEGRLDIQAVEIARANPNIWYAAAPDLFFRSDDGGQTWQQFPLRTADRGSGFPVDIEVDPRDVNRVFVNSYGGGNMLSTDGGQTWVDASAGYTGATVFGVAVLPGGGSQLIVGAETTTFISTDGGFHWAGMVARGVTEPAMAILVQHGQSGATRLLAVVQSGALLRSDDGGQSWQQVPLGGYSWEPQQGHADLLGASFAAAPNDPQTVYLAYAARACLIEDWPGCGNTVPPLYRSVDGGQTWQPLSDAPFNGQSVFSVAVGADGKVYAATLGGFYVSTDGGASWQLLDTANTFEVPWQPVLPGLSIPPITRIAADPFDARRLYAGTFINGLWVSADGGQTWQRATGVEPNASPFHILPDPQRQGVVYAAMARSGVYYSADSGQTWQSLSQGLNFRDFHNLALSEDGSVLYAGSQGAGVFRLGTPAAD